MTKCVFACLKRHLGLLTASLVMGAILAIGFAFVVAVAFTGGIAALAALAGAIGGAAVTIHSCVVECKGR